MKAISLWQPFASLIAAGHKTIETRRWPTSHRGDLLICAAQRRMGFEELYLMASMERTSREIPRPIPYGQALAIVRVVGCRRMVEADEDAACCDLYSGAWAWLLEDIRKIAPFPVRGKQMFFHVELPATAEGER